MSLRPRTNSAANSSTSRETPRESSILAEPAHAKLLARYLKKIVVRVVRMRDFHLSKATIEKADIDTVVGEFRKFLETALDGDARAESTILEIR
jgi:hypothetical protein